MNHETIEESAKAIQEVAKTTGVALNITAGFTGWIGEVIGRPIAEAVGYYVTDRLQAKRIEAAIYDRTRFVELLKKVDAVIDGQMINVRPLPPKVSIPLLEGATMEFDDRLQALWANLLATAIDADKDPVERQYVSILAELSVSDAEALQRCWTASFEVAKAGTFRDGPVGYPPSIETGHYGIDDHVTANLTRLGLVTAGTVELGLYVPAADYEYASASQHRVGVPGDPSFVVFTGLGRAFCRAVGMVEPPEAGQG